MPLKTCAACEGPVSAAGRKSLTGAYYCSKIDCRRERDRLRAQRWREEHAPEPVSAMSTGTRVTLELEAEERRRVELAKLRAALLAGGLTQAEVDAEFPLSA